MKSTASTSFPIASDTDKSTLGGLFRRVYEAILISRQRQADREIARVLNLNGGMVTDSMEREIERRFGLRS